jgi:transposase
MLDHMLEPPRPVRRLEVITGSGGRRRWSADEKARILEEALAPGANVSVVARRHGMSPHHLFTWRREAKRRAADDRLVFTPVVVAPETPRAAPATCCGAVIEIVLGGAIVRVPPGTDAPALMMVLHALQSMR